MRASMSVSFKHPAVQSGSWVSGRSGTRKFGDVFVLLRNQTANAGAVDENHASSRFVKISPMAFRRPETRKSCLRQFPGHTTFGSLIILLSKGKLYRHLKSGLLPLRQCRVGSGSCVVGVLGCQW